MTPAPPSARSRRQMRFYLILHRIRQKALPHRWESRAHPASVAASRAISTATEHAENRQDRNKGESQSSQAHHHRIQRRGSFLLSGYRRRVSPTSQNGGGTEKPQVGLRESNRAGPRGNLAAFRLASRRVRTTAHRASAARVRRDEAVGMKDRGSPPGRPRDSGSQPGGSPTGGGAGFQRYSLSPRRHRGPQSAVASLRLDDEATRRASRGRVGKRPRDRSR